ncbi:acyl carrier protein [Paenibacillus sp. FJAT-26967]|uniref:acyl carrier protein n=1 Tax=Paenibacillus sp. FJAT-26967 TaxID=1729690 RepID=UPI00083934E9|nr:acyl carrier protein [Paenibacillus sp. FJAT-26967]
MSNIRNQVEQFIYELMDHKPSTALNNQLAENGFDSIMFIRLMVMIEMKYGIEIQDEFLIMKNMSTIDEVVVFIQGYTQ